MKNIKSLVGIRFGRLTVKSFAASGKNTKWLCVCDCGSEKIVSRPNLIQGYVKSCGCLNVEAAKERNSTHKHCINYSPTKIYNTWQNMKRRCLDTKNKRFARYGGRGIFICDRWLDFNCFLLDMGEPPSQKHSIERIDNNGPYSPENCRWATNSEQMKNRSNARLIEFNGKMMNLCEWANQTGINPDTIAARIKNGWSIKDALTRPVRHLSSYKNS